MEKSAIILAGGISSRLEQDKGLLLLADKPLVEHVLDAVCDIVDETILVVSSKIQAGRFARVVDSNVLIAVDASNLQTPLMGALTGFEEAHGMHSLLLPCDSPLVSKDVLLLLQELCVDKNAVIPRWPNGYMEPLQASYRTKPALEAIKTALDQGKLDMRSMIGKLQDVLYVSTIALRQLDPGLRTFFNINTLADLEKAESILKSLNTYPKS